MKSKILLLEDDYNLSETISEYFEEQGFEIVCVFNGEEAVCKAYEESFDLYLFDVNVPKKSGFEVLKELRGNGKTTPTIFITSLNSMHYLEEGFLSGCDDYMRKPFELKELLLRVQVLIKKEFPKKNEIIKITPNITFNSTSNELKDNDELVKLNLKELKLLKLFLQNPNELLSHDRIYDFVWDYDEEHSDNSLRTYIKNLRKILGKDKIVSFKKFGYKFNQ